MPPENHQANLKILRNMANDLIEQYFLPTVNILPTGSFVVDERSSFIQGAFKLPLDESLIQKTLLNLQTESIDETSLDELQMRVRSVCALDLFAFVDVDRVRSSKFSRRTISTDNLKRRLNIFVFSAKSISLIH
jgi:hypothetical protein